MAKKKKQKLTKEERALRRREEIQQAKREAREHPVLFTVYVVLRVLVLAVLVLQLFNGEYYDVFLCALTLTLFMIPSFVERRLHIDVPNTLEVIILLFIFSAEILGEIQEYYLTFPFWDTMLHTINGFLMAAIGIAMVDILNRSRRFKVRLSPVFVAVVAFCFSMTIGVLWEFFEYGMDTFFQMDMQKDTWINVVNTVSLNPNGENSPVHIPIESVVVNGEEWPGYLDIGIHDTMKDLFVNFIGAVVFSVIGMIYIMGRGTGSFAPRFIPRLKENELPAPEKREKNEERPSLLEPIPLDGPESSGGPELQDLYTRDGKFTGGTVERGGDKGEYFTLGVHAYIYDGNGRFLLQKRSESRKFRPGQWEITMGHATAGETAAECLVREIREELGVQLPGDDIIKAYRWIETESHSFTDVFFVRADLDDSALTMQTAEVSGLQWVSKAEMLELVGRMDYRTENYRTVVAEYIRECIV
ncbi:NUDIX domain-containing protein [Acutalibacter sp. 1XD8-36]|uniref:NUDIX domain-containing protein n=1 Tax=Acutalibacter sp. 1XD8-36 TaxID=2320852 RepID=UPI001411D067|nr:NUDIX domain-containing protein [Acutalibacter sp. 1XD8-36]